MILLVVTKEARGSSDWQPIKTNILQLSLVLTTWWNGCVTNPHFLSLVVSYGRHGTFGSYNHVKWLVTGVYVISNALWFHKARFCSETFKTEMYNQNNHEEIKWFKLFNSNKRIYILYTNWSYGYIDVIHSTGENYALESPLKLLTHNINSE